MLQICTSSSFGILTGIAALQIASFAAAEPSVERGMYLVEGPAACGNCHTPQGPDGPNESMHLGGMLIEQNEAFTAVASNITPASRVATWTDAELARAIREGLRPDGSVIGPPMPIGLYRGLSDDDLMSIVMYLRQVPQVEHDPGQSAYFIPLPDSYGSTIETVEAPAPGVTVAYGEYLAGPVAHCIECHSTFGPQGPMLETHLGAGGYEFRGPWGTSVAQNITPTGLSAYSNADLVGMIAGGVRPGGAPMMPPMPYANFALMTKSDLDAVILYLRSLPALPDG